MTAKEQGLPGAVLAYEEWCKPRMSNVEPDHPQDAFVAGYAAALASDTGERGVVVAWLHEVAADGGEPDQALSFSRNSFPLEGVAGYRTTSVRPLYAHPQAQASAPGECGDGLADCPFCGGPPAYVGGETTGYEVRCGHCGGKSGWGDYGYQASAKWNRRAGYSLDADPRGIRSAAADAITGALALGAHGNNRPPNGHWLLPFWEAARADALRAQPAGGGDIPQWALPAVESALAMLDEQGYAHTDLAAFRDWLKESTP